MTEPVATDFPLEVLVARFVRAALGSGRPRRGKATDMYLPGGRFDPAGLTFVDATPAVGQVLSGAHR